MSKKKKKSKYTITSEELRNMEKAEERKLRIEAGNTYWPSSVHKSSKKDQQDRQSNNIKDYDS